MTYPAAHSRSRRSRAKRLDIQGLRAVAVVGVLLDHVLGWPQGGFLGVDVFFVISGYLITGLLLAEAQRSGSISLKDFYVRRIRRIIPLALVVLAFTVVVADRLLSPSQAGSVRTDAAWVAVFMANWHFAASGTDYFNLGAAVSPLQHYWSLAVEEQFYLVWPVLLVLAIRRFGRSALRITALGFASAICLGSVLWSLREVAQSPTLAYFSSLTRAWELAIGAALAAVGRAQFNPPDHIRRLLSHVGLAGILAAYVIVGPEWGAPTPAAVGAVLATSLVIVAGLGRREPNVLLASTPLVAVGDVSYGIYLWHFPLTIFVAEYVVRGTVPYAVICIVGALVAAAVSRHLFEAPILGLPRRTPQRERQAWQAWRSRFLPKMSRAALAGSALALLTGTSLAHLEPVGSLSGPTIVAGAGEGDEVAAAVDPAVSGPPQGTLPPSSPSASPGPTSAAKVTPPGPSRAGVPVMTPLGLHIQAGLNDGSALNSWDGVSDPSPTDPQAGNNRTAEFAPCGHTDIADPESCTFGNRQGPEVDVVGSSIAMNRINTVVAALGKDYRVRGLTHESCSMIDGITFPDAGWAKPCLDQGRKAVEYVKAHRPALVVFADSLSWPGRLSSGAKGEAAAREWAQRVSSFLGQMKPYAGQIVVLSPPPVTGNVADCYRPSGSPSRCTSGISTFYNQVSQAMSTIPGVSYIDTRHWYCTTQQRCPVVTVLDGKRFLVHIDAAHITTRYDAALGPLLREHLTVLRLLPE